MSAYDQSRKSRDTASSSSYQEQGWGSSFREKPFRRREEGWGKRDERHELEGGRYSPSSRNSYYDKPPRRGDYRGSRLGSSSSSDHFRDSRGGGPYHRDFGRRSDYLPSSSLLPPFPPRDDRDYRSRDRSYRYDDYEDRKYDSKTHSNISSDRHSDNASSARPRDRRENLDDNHSSYNTSNNISPNMDTPPISPLIEWSSSDSDRRHMDSVKKEGTSPPSPAREHYHSLGSPRRKFGTNSDSKQREQDPPRYYDYFKSEREGSKKERISYSRPCTTWSSGGDGDYSQFPVSSTHSDSDHNYRGSFRERDPHDSDVRDLRDSREHDASEQAIHTTAGSGEVEGFSEKEVESQIQNKGKPGQQAQLALQPDNQQKDADLGHPTLEGQSPSTAHIQQEPAAQVPTKEETLCKIDQKDSEISQLEHELASILKVVERLTNSPIVPVPPPPRQTIDENKNDLSAEEKQNDDTQSEIPDIASDSYKENQARAAFVHDKLARLSCPFPENLEENCHSDAPKEKKCLTSPTEYPLFAENAKSFEVFKPLLQKVLVRRKKEVFANRNLRKQEYRQLLSQWKRYLTDKGLYDEEDEELTNFALETSSAFNPLAQIFPPHNFAGALGSSVSSVQRTPLMKPTIPLSVSAPAVLSSGSAAGDATISGERELYSRFMSTLAVIPPLISDPYERKLRFIDNNRLVPNTKAEDIQFRQQMWSVEEERVFVKHWNRYHKDFARIASHLPNKTVKDCIRFYYINKKRLELKPPREAQTSQWLDLGQRATVQPAAQLRTPSTWPEGTVVVQRRSQRILNNKLESDQRESKVDDDDVDYSDGQMEEEPIVGSPPAPARPGPTMVTRIMANRSAGYGTTAASISMEKRGLSVQARQELQLLPQTTPTHLSHTTSVSTSTSPLQNPVQTQAQLQFQAQIERQTRQLLPPAPQRTPNNHIPRDSARDSQNHASAHPQLMQLLPPYPSPSQPQLPRQHAQVQIQTQVQFENDLKQVQPPKSQNFSIWPLPFVQSKPEQDCTIIGGQTESQTPASGEREKSRDEVGPEVTEKTRAWLDQMMAIPVPSVRKSDFPIPRQSSGGMGVSEIVSDTNSERPEHVKEETRLDFDQAKFMQPEIGISDASILRAPEEPWQTQDPTAPPVGPFRSATKDIRDGPIESGNSFKSNDTRTQETSPASETGSSSDIQQAPAVVKSHSILNILETQTDSAQPPIDALFPSAPGNSKKRKRDQLEERISSKHPFDMASPSRSPARPSNLEHVIVPSSRRQKPGDLGNNVHMTGGIGVFKSPDNQSIYRPSGDLVNSTTPSDGHKQSPSPRRVDLYEQNARLQSGTANPKSPLHQPFNFNLPFFSEVQTKPPDQQLEPAFSAKPRLGGDLRARATGGGRSGEDSTHSMRGFIPFLREFTTDIGRSNFVHTDEHRTYTPNDGSGTGGANAMIYDTARSDPVTGSSGIIYSHSNWVQEPKRYNNSINSLSSTNNNANSLVDYSNQQHIHHNHQHSDYLAEHPHVFEFNHQKQQQQQHRAVVHQSLGYSDPTLSFRSPNSAGTSVRMNPTGASSTSTLYQVPGLQSPKSHSPLPSPRSPSHVTPPFPQNAPPFQANKRDGATLPPISSLTLPSPSGPSKTLAPLLQKITGTDNPWPSEEEQMHAHQFSHHHLHHHTPQEVPLEPEIPNYALTHPQASQAQHWHFHEVHPHHHGHTPH